MLFLFPRFLHVASAMWFIGGILARQIVRAYAKRMDDVRRFAVMSEAAGRTLAPHVICLANHAVSKARWSSPATSR